MKNRAKFKTSALALPCSEQITQNSFVNRSNQFIKKIKLERFIHETDIVTSLINMAEPNVKIDVKSNVWIKYLLNDVNYSS